ncbi:MAG: serine hydrolase domain-containing protein, partial [Myxococcota bacterium]
GSPEGGAVSDSIDGWVASGFERVRDEFLRNFHERGEVGAACAAFVDGGCVVDLWGGVADPRTGRRWQEDTLVAVFSTSKGIAALVMAMAASRGYLDYDQPVAAYWPEFAANGKADVTVRQLLGHEAGLSYVEGLTRELLGDPESLAPLLAAQSPHWPPGTRHGYHALTIGLYESALLRRVDPKARGIHQFLQDEVASPLGLEFYFGVPDAISDERIAWVTHRSPRRLLPDLVRLPPRLFFGVLDRRSITGRTLSSVPGLDVARDIWRPPYRGMEIAAGNGIGQVRSIARFYGEFAAGGTALGIDPSVLRDLERPSPPIVGGDLDAVLRTPMRFQLGFSKPSPIWRFGTDDRAYGTPGAGGSFGVADPTRRVGFAYAPNTMGMRLWDDPRELALRNAVYEAASA